MPNTPKDDTKKLEADASGMKKGLTSYGDKGFSLCLLYTSRCV